MNGLDATLIMLALFALRCVVPLAVTAGLGYLMNRLVDRWEAEEALAQAPQKQPLPAPAAVTGHSEREPQPVLSLLSLPCWVTNSCPEKKRKGCPAYAAKGIPCWQARLQAEDALPAGCPDCPRYAAGQAALA